MSCCRNLQSSLLQHHELPVPYAHGKYRRNLPSTTSDCSPEDKCRHTERYILSVQIHVIIAAAGQSQSEETQFHWQASLWQVACNHKHAGRYDTDEKEGECNENFCLIQFVINRNAKKYKKQNQRDPTGIIIFCKYLNRIFKKQRKRQIFGELGASGRT